MPLGNPIRKQNESRVVSVLATEGQTVFTVQGGYIINQISVFRNGVRLSNSEDFTAGDGSTVTLNNAANVDDRIEFHIFDRFTVQNAIVGAASTQTISGDVVVNGKIFGNLDVPSINTGIGTFGGTVSIADSIVHTGDTDTSIRFPAADTITAETGGSERLRIGSTGKVLIGDDTAENTIGLNANVQTFGTDASSSGFAIKRGSNDAQAAFLVLSKSRNTSVGSRTILQNGDEVGNIFFVADDGTDLLSETAAIKSQINGAPGANDTPGNLSFWTTSDGANSVTRRMTIGSTGRVLIGDSTARAQDGGNNAQLQVSSATGGNWARISSSSFTSGDDIGGGLILTKSRSGTVGVHTVVANGDKLGSIFFEGSDGTDYERGAHIEAFVDGAPGDNDMPGRLVFSTTPDGSVTPAERLRITSDGELLIGTTTVSPHIRLNQKIGVVQVGNYGGISLTNYGGTTAVNKAILDFNRSRGTSNASMTSVASGDGLAHIVFRGADGTNFIDSAGIRAVVDGAPGTNDMPGRLVFETTADGSNALSERMRITSAGKILIGSTAARVESNGFAAPLQVEGTGTATASVIIARNSNNAASSQLIFQKSRGTSTGSNTVIQSGDAVGTIIFEGSDGTNTDSLASIIGACDGTPGTNDVPGRLVFSTTADGSASPTERLRITSAGQILVGTTSDGGQYDGVTPAFVSEASSAYHAYSLVVNSTNAGHSGILQFVRSRGTSDGANTIVQSGDRLGSIYGIGADGTDRNSAGAAIDFRVDGTPGSNDMPGRIEFRTTADGASTPSERLRIDSAGRVIITNDGVTNPTGTNTQYAPLVVRGNTSATSSRAAFITFARSEASANIAADEGIGEIYFGDQQAGEYAAIRCHADAAAAVGDYPGRLTFHTTADGASSLTERMRITAGGQILVSDGTIGWLESSALLNIATDDAAGANMLSDSSAIYNHNNPAFIHVQNRYNTGTGQEAGIIFHSKSSYNGSWAIYSKRTSSNFLADLIFRNRTASAASAERLRIASTGVITNSLSSDNTIAVTLRNDGITGGHCLKLTSGGTGAGTNVFSVFRNNQSSEGLIFNIDGTGHVKIGPTSFGTTSEGMTIRPGNESTLFRDTGIVLLLGGGQSGQKIIDFRHGGTGIGNITKSGTSGIVYNTSSDYRLKENVTAISDGITRLKTLKPSRFNFKVDASTTVDGFLAHEVTAVPEAITGTKDEVDSDNNPVYQGIDQSRLVPLLTAALQEAVAKIETLETKVAALEGS